MQESDIQLHKWFASNIGTKILRAEWQRINNFCGKLHGDNKLVITSANVSNFVERGHFKHTIFLSAHDNHGHYKDNFILSLYDELPLQFRSVDCIIINHVLEFTLNPYKILREIDKIIKPNGHVIISSFNALSFYGLQKLFSSKKNILTHSKCWQLRQIEEWLKVLSFKIIKDEHEFYRPLVNNKYLLDSFMVLDIVGRMFFDSFGSVNLIYAKKQISNLTPIKNSWCLADSLLKPGLVKSVT